MKRQALCIAPILLFFSLLAPPGAHALPVTDVCDPEETPITTEAGASPTFAVDDSGHVSAIGAEEARPQITDSRGRIAFRVDLAGAVDAIVRVELAQPSSTDRGTSLGCGEVQRGDVVVIQAAPPGRGRRVLRISVYRPVSGPDEARRYSASLATRVAALETEANGAAFASAQLRTLVTDDLVALLQSGDHAALATQLADLSAGIGALRAAVECGVPVSTAPFRDQVCALASRVEARLAAVIPAVAILQAPPTEQAAAEARVTVRQGLIEIRAAADDHPEVDIEQLCLTAAQLRWLRTEDAPRVATVLEVPWTASPIELATWDDGTRRIETERDATIGGVLVSDVPLSQRDITFRQRRGELTSGSLATALSRFGRLVARVGGLGPRAVTDVCRDFVQSRVDDDVAPIGTVGTRAYVVREFPNDRITEIDMCAGDACSDATARGTLRIVPRRGVEFATLLEAGVDFLPGQITGAGAGTLAYTQPRYAAAGGNQGPEQVYLLDDEVRVGRIFTLSALLGVTFPLGPTRGLAALGIVLFDAEGKRSFTEGQLRFGVEVTTHVFLTIGASITVLQRDVDRGQPRAVVVTRTGGPGTTPTAPPLDLDDGVVLSASLGLALDLAVFGEAAEDIVKALGGS